MVPRRKVAEGSILVESAEPKVPTLTIKDLDPSERPRERLIERGPEALSTTELLAILLRTGAVGLMVTDLARDLLRDYSGLRGIAGASARELATRHGLGPAKAAQLKAALEIGRRLVGEEFAERPKVGGPEDLANLVRLEMEVLEQEHLRVFMLDTKNRVVTIPTVYIGTINQSAVRVAEVFKAAIRENCASIAVVHNHPSGDPTPSPEDIRVTQDLVDAGRLLGIEVLDHIIIGRGPKGWLSLRQRGLGFRS